MTKQLEALIRRLKIYAEEFSYPVLSPDDCVLLIAALEQAQQSAEVAELLRDKVKRLESDIWDSQQLVKVKSENQYELECKVRELEDRNDKSNIAWSRREDAALEKLEAAENRIAELEAKLELEREKSRRVMSQNHQLEASPSAVKLPNRLQPGADGPDDWYLHSDPDGEYMNADDVIEAIRAAGGTVEGE